MNTYTPSHVFSLLGTLVSFTGTLKYQCLKRRNLRVVGKEKKMTKGMSLAAYPFGDSTRASHCAQHWQPLSTRPWDGHCDPKVKQKGEGGRHGNQSLPFGALTTTTNFSAFPIHPAPFCPFANALLLARTLSSLVCQLQLILDLSLAIISAGSPSNIG